MFGERPTLTPMIEWTRNQSRTKESRVYSVSIRAMLAWVFLLFVTPASAHPHVFVDGGVDFRFADDGRLEALEVTWLYDEFETLYILSSNGMSLNEDGELSEVDRRRLVAIRSQWPEDFDGSAHLSVSGESIELEWPSGLDGALVDGRLQMTFTRELKAPITLRGQDVKVAFYESTYFFAFSITQIPSLLGNFGDCQARVEYFEATKQDSALQVALQRLSREETPEIANVGALFADKAILSCG